MAKRCAGAVLVMGVALAALTGCGQDPSAGEPVPGLVQGLERIDDSIAAGRYSRARAEIDALLETTSEARRAGDLDTAQADEIAAAAARLRAALPTLRPGTPDDATSPTGSPSTSPVPREDGEEGHGRNQGKGHGRGHEDD